MQKSILIIGRQGSGKTTKAKEIASQFQNDEVVFIDYRWEIIQDDPFLFSECTDKTKLVVFEGFYDINQVETFFNAVSNPINVNKKMKRPFTIQPKFVFVCQREIEELEARFYRTFDIIEL
jgi:ABC-type glutathione transport system ATPase component